MSHEVILYHFDKNPAASSSPVLSMLHTFFLQLLEVSPRLALHFPTERVFKTRKRWPGPPLTSTSLPIELEVPGETPNAQTGRTSHSRGHEDLADFVFSTEELCEILLSILNDDIISRATFLIGGVEEMYGYNGRKLKISSTWFSPPVLGKRSDFLSLLPLRGPFTNLETKKHFESPTCPVSTRI